MLMGRSPLGARSGIVVAPRAACHAVRVRDRCGNEKGQPSLPLRSHPP